MVTARNALDVLIPELAKVRAQESGSKADPMSEYSVSVSRAAAAADVSVSVIAASHLTTYTCMW